MAISDWVARQFGYIRYSNGSHWYRILQNNTTYINGQDKLQLALKHSTLSSVISIRADYLSKARFYIEEADGTKNFDDSSLDFIKNPNPHQSTEDFLMQHEWFLCSYGWNYQRPYISTQASGGNVRYIYNLNASQIQFPKKMGNYLITTRTEEREYYRKEFSYTDVNNTKSIRFEDIIPFYDVLNAADNCDKDTVTSPSRLESIIREVSNVNLASDAENVVLQTNGKIIYWSEEGGGNLIKSQPLNQTDKDNIKRVLNTPLGYKNGEKNLAADKKIGHLDTTIPLGNLGLNSSRETNSNIIAQRYQVPNEIYKAFMKGDTFENQKEAELGFIQNVMYPRANDLANSWTNMFGDKNRPIKASYDHLESMQVIEEKKAQRALNITVAMRNLIQSELNESQAREFLLNLGVDLQ